MFWVASLADGMNLTAQEYVTARTATARPGVLVLSRHAGIAQHLAGAAVLTDPHSPADLARARHEALTMTPEQRRRHITDVAARMRFREPVEWAQSVVTAIRAHSK
ncbi:trehalose-6-phosphate synthase [Streptomyces sp. NPDC015346]|uniref:trehalose-6-phosphate synthase n=1 Tax=Streptomyces sp. NPDC015346 TaxID=3364954 RepID=UPI0036FBFA94